MPLNSSPVPCQLPQTNELHSLLTTPCTPAFPTCLTFQKYKHTIYTSACLYQLQCCFCLEGPHSVPSYLANYYWIFKIQCNVTLWIYETTELYTLNRSMVCKLYLNKMVKNVILSRKVIHPKFIQWLSSWEVSDNNVWLTNVEYRIQHTYILIMEDIWGWRG